MSDRELPGRGTADNPPNRYDPLHVELDPDPDVDQDGEPGREPTVFYRDTSKSILAENSSPDIGFTFSLNPYRGCEHGCIYCLVPETPVLCADMAWRPIGELRVGDELVGFDEYPEPGRTRKLRKATVESVSWSKRLTHRVITEQTEVAATADGRTPRLRLRRRFFAFHNPNPVQNPTKQESYEKTLAQPHRQNAHPRC